ncbi:MAG: hypothetical protein JO332_06030 [Planctomycetaceae bacterium]|nr:hypothetical protein [Planctomycetaceae bacterium]
MRSSARLGIVALLCLQACSLLSPSKEDVVLKGNSPKGPISFGELEQAVLDLADCYAMGVAEGCERVARGSADPAVRRSTLYLKLRNATSTYDVVTSGDAFDALLDLVTLIELQNMVWVDEARMARYPPGPARDSLQATLSKSRTDAWALADRALTKDQVRKVKGAIQDWRKRNPEVQWVSFVRFSSGTESTAFNLLNEIRGGLGGLINPFGGTEKSVEETRQVAARAFFFAKRLPMLLEWEAEAAAAGIVDTTQIAALSRGVAELPDQARSLLRHAAGGLLVLLLAGFALLLAYRRVSLGWERKQRPASSQRPPTRPLPAP